MGLRRLFDVAVGTGVDINHPKLIRAEKILIDRLADRVLKEAVERQQKDADAAAKQGDKMTVGPAALAADKIDKALREADGQRKRLAARQKRLEAEGRA